ncbi:hypothetical protein BT63DRAFT_411938 [Microthyrium microscopicum]|uniref:Uncharacterized protein n=1 Tax=Microthyrium microscopicum TaxID=703497 RepID=A0A6A6UH19_9PEZI|nr:hypothetical protein BT63DRAFT_411938 [Microthyrium microscopicum]
MAPAEQSTQASLADERENTDSATTSQIVHLVASNNQEPELWSRLPAEIKVIIVKAAINNSSIPSGMRVKTLLRITNSYGEHFTEARLSTDLPVANETVLRQTSKEMSSMLDDFHIVQPAALHFRLTFLNRSVLRRTKITSQLSWTQLPCALPLKENSLVPYASLTANIKLQPGDLDLLRSEPRSKLHQGPSSFTAYDLRTAADYQAKPSTDNEILDWLLFSRCISMMKSVVNSVFRPQLSGVSQNDWDPEVYGDKTQVHFKHLTIVIHEFHFPDTEGHGIMPVIRGHESRDNITVRIFFKCMFELPTFSRWTAKIHRAVTLRFENMEFTAEKKDGGEAEDFEIAVKYFEMNPDTISPAISGTSIETPTAQISSSF